VTTYRKFYTPSFSVGSYSAEAVSRQARVCLARHELDRRGSHLANMASRQRAL